MYKRQVSLFAEPGQKIAFVGSTGAGKTTITNLINRFYDIQKGKIRYDEINIGKIKKDDLRRSLGIVLQDTHLFTGTVREDVYKRQLDLRGLFGAIGTMRQGLSPYLAVQIGIVNKCFDLFEKEIVRDVVRTRIPEEWTPQDVF